MLLSLALFALLSATAAAFSFRTVGFGVWDGVVATPSEEGLKTTTVKLNVTDGASGRLEGVALTSFFHLADWHFEYDATDPAAFKLYEQEAVSTDAPVRGPRTLLCAGRWANLTAVDAAAIVDTDPAATFACYGSVSPLRDPATAKLSLTLADRATGAASRTYLLTRRPLATKGSWWEENRRNAMMVVLVLGYAYLKNYMRNARKAAAAEAGEGRPLRPGTAAARVASAAEVEAEAKKVL